jgi:membrane associated rhomboid family serine protease
MFVILPWQVDVARDRWPVMNWLIMGATIAVFSLQVRDIREYRANQYTHIRDTPRQGPQTPPSIDGPHSESPSHRDMVPGITGRFMLHGWRLTGLLGHMWLHGGLLHLLGNMWFLWIFGNAVCSKVGNIKYFLFYVLLGVAAGVSHLLCDGDPAIGASGAINGVVGMYLVLFYENEITCLFALWIILPIYIRWFAVSSIWIIILWVFWDIVGAFWGTRPVAYFAHLGGFAAGFGMVMFLCAKGWITMERYEKSLLQAWQERRAPRDKESLGIAYATLGLPAPNTEEYSVGRPSPPAETKPIPLPKPEPAPARHVHSRSAFIRTVCGCGREVSVSRQYAGKTVRCPGCDQYVVIPRQSDFFGPPQPQARPSPGLPPPRGSRSIRFICTCGTKIKVSARYAGRFGKCPGCGLRLRIPPASS